MSQADPIFTDHGKIYVTEHLMTACQRLGISIQPARIRQRPDNGSLEQFVRPEPDGPPQSLIGSAGSDINARSLETGAYAIDPYTKAILPTGSVTERFSGKELHDGSR